MSNPMDDIFRRKLEGHQVPVSDRLWENIQAQRLRSSGAPSSHGQRWPLFALLFMFVAITGHTLFLQKKSTPNTLDSFPILQPNRPNSPEYTPSANPAIEDIALRQNTTPSGNSGEFQAELPQKGKTTSTGNTAFVNSIHEEKPSPIILHKEKDHLSNLIIEEKTNRPLEKLIPFDLLNPINSENLTEQKSTIEGFAPLTTLSFSVIHPNEQLSSFGAVIPIKKTRTPIFYSVELMMGLHTSFKTFPSALSEDNKNYLSLRQSTEKARLGYSTSLRTELEFPKGWSLTTGIRYNQITERFAYENDQETRLDEVLEVYNPTGVLLRSDTTYITGFRQKVTYNRFHALDVVLKLGYTREFGDIKVGIHTGPSFNFYLNKKGDFISPLDFQPVSFTDGEAASFEAFRSNLGTSWLLNLKLSYQFNRMELFAEPYYQYFFQTITQPDFDLQQKYQNVGIGVGIKYTLPRKKG